MTSRQRWQTMVYVTTVLTMLLVIFAATSLLTSFIYHLLGWEIPPFAAQLITSMLGVFFSILTLGFIAHSLRDKQREVMMGVFQPIIDGMQQIAKGDFSVQLPVEITPNRDNPLVGELAKNVNNMATELNQMEQMRQEFISNVSHELQSPLTSIRGFAQALQNEQTTVEERHRYLAIIETESTRLSRLTDNLLKLASLEAVHLKVEPTAYRLDKQIRRLILACEPQWMAKAIEMDVALEEVMITADEDLLSQVWINLIHNSIKFMPQGGNIGMSLQQQGNSLTFQIKDSGIGISTEDQAHIFERFYKADKSRTRTDSNGSGLGLSIAHKIVEIHKGQITVESTPNVGTTFTVCLPET